MLNKAESESFTDYSADRQPAGGRSVTESVGGLVSAAGVAVTAIAATRVVWPYLKLRVTCRGIAPVSISEFGWSFMKTTK